MLLFRDLRLALKRWEALTVVAVLLSLTLALAALVSRECRKADQARVVREAALLAALVKQRFDSHKDGLIALRVGVERGARHNWRSFSNQVEMLYPSLNFPAFVDFSYLYKTHEDYRREFRGMTANNAHREFDLLFPGGVTNRWESFPVMYHHFVCQHDAPQSGVFTNWGLDVYQDPQEKEYILWAWGADRPSTTRGGPSVWGQGSPSQIRVYVPVMAMPNPEEMDGQTRSIRQSLRKRFGEMLSPSEFDQGVRADWNWQAMLGMLVGTIDVSKLLAAAFPSNAPSLAIAIDDDMVATNAHRLAGELPATAYLRTERKERYYGRNWRFQFATTPAWEETSLQRWPFAVLSFGGTVSVVTGLAAGVWASSRERDRAARFAAERQSVELVRARDDLHAVLAARDQLQRNLHDAVLQRLYAVALHARRCWQSVVRGERVAPADLEMQVSELDEAMCELRGFLSSPSRRVLTGPELASALRGMARAFSRQTAVHVNVEVEPEIVENLSDERGEHLLQIFREALSNAWRHGHATQVVLRASRGTDGMTVVIEDDGQGFDPAISRSHGLGLGNMAERAAMSGGTLVVNSKPGGPTLLRIDWKTTHEHEA